MTGKEAGEPDNAELYKLVYAGEINEGQHAAVVKKRLASVLKLDDERMNVLFSGKAVVVKKATDARTAARYQEAFKKAGARLRVQPVEDEAPARGEAASSAPVPAQPSAPQSSKPPESPPSDGDLQVMPAGSDVLTDAEKAAPQAVEVDTSHLSVQGAVFVTDEPEPEVTAPSVDHLSMAEPGAALGDAQPEVEVEIDTNFDVADVGADLGEISRNQDAPLDMESVDFDVADVGADLDTVKKDSPPPAPDTSHLSLDDALDNTRDKD